MIYLYYPGITSKGGTRVVNKINNLGGEAAYASAIINRSPGTTWINWGTRDHCEGMINGNPPRTKYDELVAFRRGQVPTVPFALTRPPGADWRARTQYHVDGNDFAVGAAHGAYYVQLVPTDWEMRFHIMGGVSILAGTRVPGQGNTYGGTPSHPFIRTTANGWTYTYSTASRPSNESHIAQCREASKLAVATGFDFGAVDVGWRSDGQGPVVFEVNMQPGLEGYDVEIYAKKIMELWG
jgi:hypothetical protein